MPAVGGKEIGSSPGSDYNSHLPSVLLRRRMSLPTLPSSQGDIIIPLPDQATIDSKLKHLRGDRKTTTPSGLVVDPLHLLQCASGSGSTTFTVGSGTTYTHPGERITVASSSTTNQQPIFSFPSPSKNERQSDDSTLQSVPSPLDENKDTPMIEHFEVDPHARGVLTFRRNSLRKFSPIIEEADKEKSSFLPPKGGRQPGFTTPLFVISDGIRRAYFPGASQATTSEEDSQSHIVKENEDNSVSMYEQYSNTKLLRKIQSFPELQSMGEMEDRSAMSFGKTSPELIRKEKITGSVSLLSHMAGELRSHIAVKSNELALPDKKGVSQSKREITKTETVEQVGTSTEVSSPEYVELPEDVKPKNKSFVKTFFKWSTESKVKVSDKETNFYAPTSF